MRLGPLLPVQLLVAALALLAVPARGRAETRVLVVPVHNAGGAPFDQAVERLVAKPLKRHANVLPAAAARPTLRRAHVAPRAAHVAKNAQKLGRVAKAAFVLVVEAAGKRPKLAAVVTLVDVGSGQAVFSHRYPLPGGKLSAEVATELLSPVTEHLEGAADAGGADEDAPAPSPAGRKKGGKFAFKGSEGDGGDAAAADGADGAATAGDGNGDGDTKADGEDKADDPAAKGPHGPRWRPGLRLAVGTTFERRTGTLSGVLPAGITRLPCYCGQGGSANPFFPGAQLQIELFPWALGASGESLLEGLGLEVEFFATQIKSYITYYAADGTLAQPKSVVSSVVLDVRANVAFRYVFWSSPLAPDLEAQLGVSVYSFPLHNGTFPGVAYTAPTLGLQAHVPLGVEQVALVGGLTYLPSVLAGDDAGDKVNQMLGLQSGGSGFSGQVGLRFAFDNFEVHGMYRYEGYALKYTGETHLQVNDANVEKQLNNVGLNDRLDEIRITVGVVF